MRIRHIALCAAAAWAGIGLAAASAQQAAPKASAADRQADRPRSSMTTNLPPQNEAELRARHPELYVLPAVSRAYQPRKTSWGDPDLRGMWPTDSIGGLPLQRPAEMGERVFLSPAELKARDDLMDQWRHAAADEIKQNHLGAGHLHPVAGEYGDRNNIHQTSQLDQNPLICRPPSPTSPPPHRPASARPQPFPWRV